MGPSGTLWFLTSADSSKVREIARNASVNIAFLDSGAETYVSIAGNALMVLSAVTGRDFEAGENRTIELSRT